MRFPSRTSIALTLAAAVLASACGDDDSGGNGPGDAAQVSLSVTTSATIGSPLNLDQTVTLGADEIIVTSAQVVLKEIEFERSEASSTCEDDVSGGSDDCEELEVGPILLDLPLDGGIAQEFAVVVDTGHFDELEFKVHKPEDGGDAADQAFLAANPDFQGVSIRVEGTWNGTPFTFESDLDVEQEFDLAPPLVIAQSASVNVTLKVNLGEWFVNATRDGLVDPATANTGGANEGLVKENIKVSFEAFEDDDHDGSDDD